MSGGIFGGSSGNGGGGLTFPDLGGNEFTGCALYVWSDPAIVWNSTTSEVDVVINNADLEAGTPHYTSFFMANTGLLLSIEPIVTATMGSGGNLDFVFDPTGVNANLGFGSISAGQLISSRTSASANGDIRGFRHKVIKIIPSGFEDGGSLRILFLLGNAFPTD